MSLRVGAGLPVALHPEVQSKQTRKVPLAKRVQSMRALWAEFQKRQLSQGKLRQLFTIFRNTLDWHTKTHRNHFGK
jgi:hypothetical protein